MHRWMPRLAPFALGLALAIPPAHAGEGADIGAATEEQKKAAQDHYIRGTKEFEAKRFDQAFTEFSASYGIVKSPNAHMMMGRALLAQGQAARAYNELWLVEQEAAGQERYAAAVEKSRALREEAARKIAVVTFQISGDQSKPVQITVDELPVPAGRPYGLNPGKAAVRAFRSAKMRDTEQLDLKAGETRTVALDVGPADPEPIVPQAIPPKVVASPPKPKPAPAPVGSGGSGFVIAGSLVSVVGISGLVVGGGLYKLATDDYDALVEACGEPPTDGNVQCPAGVNVAGLKEAGDEKQTGAIGAFIAGGVITALGIGLVIGGEYIDKEEAKRRKNLAVRVGPGSLVVEGRF